MWPSASADRSGTAVCIGRSSRVVDAGQVTAVLITRGDVDLDPILETLPYDDVVVWDGRERDEQPGTYGRYLAMYEAAHDVVYLQDDDCVFCDHDALLAEYRPGMLTAVYGHGENPDGLEDVALVHGGAVVDRSVSLRAFDKYLTMWPVDEGFYREADMIHGTLCPSRQLPLPYEIRMEVATRPSRMANQPWQRGLKHEITERARAVRDSR